MLSDITLTQKSTYFVIPFIWSSRTGKTKLWWNKIGTIVDNGGLRAEIDLKEFTGVMIMFYVFIWVLITQVYEFFITQQKQASDMCIPLCIHFTWNKKYIYKHYTLINDIHTDFLRGRCTDACNLLRNASKGKMNGWMEGWIDMSSKMLMEGSRWWVYG